MSTPTSRKSTGIEPEYGTKEKYKISIRNKYLKTNVCAHTWKLTRDDKMLSNVLIPSTDTKAKRYSSKRSII